MKKIITLGIVVILLSACSGMLKKQEPICTASLYMAGQNYSVSIYEVRNSAGHTEYKAGYPFNWKWVNKNNFTKSTCQ